MTKIEIEIPDDLERKAKMLNLKLKLLVTKMLKEKIDELEEIEQYKNIISKSKATGKDVEELSNEINTEMWEYHKKKYSL